MKRTLLLSCLVLGLVTGCTSEHSSPASSSTASEARSSSTNEASRLNSSTRSAPVVVKTGRMSIESKRLEESKKEIDQLVEQSGSYYETEAAENRQGYRSYNLTIRVPMSRFDSVISILEANEDNVTSKNITTEDIRTQYIDVKTRLESKQNYLSRYQDMVEGASSVKDLLEIEEQIQKLQEDIESTASIMQSLDEQVNYFSLTVFLSEHHDQMNRSSRSFFIRAIDALIDGWYLIEHIAITFISLWPIWLIAASVGLLVYRTRIHRRQRYRARKK